MYRIAPSILSADFARLGEEVRAVITAGADWIHFDVMDNHYVPNLTIGPMVAQAIKPHCVRADGSRIQLDVHLMVQPVDALATAFAKAGADLVSFHPEASAHVDRTLQLIRSEGCQAGLAFNPATPLDVLEWVIDKVNLVLVMSVDPGVGGQGFIESALRKVERARKLIDAGALLVDVAAAVKAISAMAAKGALGGFLGKVDAQNVHGETQATLDVVANDVLLKSCEWGGLVAGMASEELDEPYAVPPEYCRGKYLLVFDPLDGSSNADVNVSIGAIFSVLRHDSVEAPVAADFLQPGARQVAAGYAIYGPATMLVLTVGKGTHGFTLDREIGNFILTHPKLEIPAETSEFAINTSNARFWESPVHRYVTECQAGCSGDRGRDFNMRWIASMVAEVHRILVRGGAFMYPRDTKDPSKPGRLRLMYEANPIGMLIEQAGGLATTGRQRILDVQPDGLHQRIPVILGSATEVERIIRYHAEHDAGTDRPYESPLFNDRSLFRPEARS